MNHSFDRSRRRLPVRDQNTVGRALSSSGRFADDGLPCRTPTGSVWSGMQVQRLTAYARLDETPAILDYACSEAELGDELWAQWVHEFDRREAMMVRLDLIIEFSEALPERCAVRPGILR
jgi:hypothetical protein